MIETRGMCNPEYRINTRLWLDFIKFSIERASDISQFLWRIYCEEGFLPSSVPHRHDFCRHISLVSCTPMLYISNVERDDTGGMQFTVFPVICPAHAVRALPKRRHLGPRQSIRAVVRSGATTREGPTEWPHAILNYFNEMG